MPTDTVPTQFTTTGGGRMTTERDAASDGTPPADPSAVTLAAQATAAHVPVMRDRILELLTPALADRGRPGVHVDGTTYLATVCAAHPARAGQGVLQRRRCADSRRSVHAGGRRPGPVGSRVPRASGSAADAGGSVAALRQLRDSRQQALAGRPARGRHPARARGRASRDRLAGHRPQRRQGPGRTPRPRPLAPVGVRAPARVLGRRRPHDHRLRHQPGRAGLDLARHGPDRAAGAMGREGGSGCSPPCGETSGGSPSSVA